jgi:hypothetical protein
MIDADHRRPQPRRSLQFAVVVNFNQYVHSNFESRFVNVFGRKIIKGRHNDENTVRPVSRASIT